MNRDLSLETRVIVYRAVCISTLLYCGETWTLYRRHLKLLERFHIASLQKILGITWRHKISHRTILERTKRVSLECMLNRNQLRWVEHVVRLSDKYRLPKQLLYGELCEGSRRAGGQAKRYKDATNQKLWKPAIFPQPPLKMRCKIELFGVLQLGMDCRNLRMIETAGWRRGGKIGTEHLLLKMTIILALSMDGPLLRKLDCTARDRSFPRQFFPAGLFPAGLFPALFSPPVFSRLGLFPVRSFPRRSFPR